LSESAKNASVIPIPSPRLLKKQTFTATSTVKTSPHEYANGTRIWKKHGELHRLDGSSVEYPDGTREWHLFGVQFTEQEHNVKILGFNFLRRIVKISKAMNFTPGKFLRLLRIRKTLAFEEWFYAPENPGGKLIKTKGESFLENLHLKI
jgi:hypothetical protein